MVGAVMEVGWVELGPGKWGCGGVEGGSDTVVEVVL